MNVYGFDAIESMLEQDGYLFKLLANENSVILFPFTTEHRDVTRPGISFEDDSKGNALAAMVKPGRIEFRFHRQYSDERVKRLAQRLLAISEFQFAEDATVTYQSRTVIDGSG